MLAELERVCHNRSNRSPPDDDRRAITTARRLPADLETCAEVLYAADDVLSASRGLPVSPRNREALVRLFVHMQTHFPDRWWVAEGRRLRSSVSAAPREYQEMIYLGFLFVLPDIQATGLGRRLLELSMHDSDYRAVASPRTSRSPPRFTRGTA